MAEMGAISGGERERVQAKQIWLALGAAFCLHISIGIFAQINFSRVQPLDIPKIISVRLMPQPVPAPKRDEGLEQAAPQNMPSPAAPMPEPVIEYSALLMPLNPKSEPLISQLPIQNAPLPILNSESGTSRGAFPAQGQEKGKSYVPSQWALEPPLSDGHLKGKGLLKDVDCLRALSEDCAALRKEVFAEFELTEMEKVWTAQRADTGMPAEFYGMSEREIRLKIGDHIAGENGFVILPGIGIDGSLWDMMHGIKKPCKMKRGIDSTGRYGIVMVCPDSLSAARDKKYYIPPKN